MCLVECAYDRDIAQCCWFCRHIVERNIFDVFVFCMPMVLYSINFIYGDIDLLRDVFDVGVSSSFAMSISLGTAAVDVFVLLLTECFISTLWCSQNSLACLVLDNWSIYMAYNLVFPMICVTYIFG